jgi:hypothetical protein
MKVQCQKQRRLNNYIALSEEGLKLIKNGNSTGGDINNSELHKYTPNEFKQRLLKFLNNVYSESTTPNEWRNATVIPIFKKGDKRDPKSTEQLTY